MRARGLIIAAPASGSGKTLVTAGLLRHLRRRDVRVAAAKAGPDFIDPTYHAAAVGEPCVNLDVWAMRPATLAALVTELGQACDLVLCEGVMGLFDGTGADGETGSTAELARITGWPVVLVIDARGQGASSAALLHGFVCHRSDILIAGVIFNRVASERHLSVLCGAVARNLPNLAVLGTLPADPAMTLPSRHLGLVPAEEAAAAESAIALAAAHIASCIEIDWLFRLARPATLAAEASSIGIPPLGQRIAIAHDDAFRFAYPILLAGWRRAGAELSFFSPLAGEPPDPFADAVYLPGGYPELWAARLAAAEAFLNGLRRAAALKRPIYGECGGYMVLGRALTDAAGDTHRMADLLPLETSFAARKLQLGYRSATLLGTGPLGSAGSAFRGHEFHYATVIREDGAQKLWSVSDAAGADLGHCGLRRDSVFGSFIHLIDSADPAALT
ncbi:MAG: cobyrinate a,c-diamide synthase [Alphaproteobacteria bacterium]|nr:cobyrinate a,c-diamide synthase [Alphaproteobacteria bacterium]